MLRRPALIVCALGALACSGDATPIQIATAGPWSESFGLMNKRGIDLALEEINAQGGVRGRPLRALVRDDQADGSRAASIAGELLANRDVIGVVGHVTSGAMMAAARVYDGGLPAIATTASTPDLSGISPWVFRVISSDSANGITIARFVTSVGARRAAILYENNSYGRGLAEAFRRSFAGQVITIDPIPSDARADYEPYVSWLRTRAPDVVFVAGTDGSGLGILRAARRVGLTSRFIGGDGWASIVSDTVAAEGAYVATPFTAQDPRATAQRFVAAFRARYQLEPDGNAALAYDATMLLARAIEEAGPSRTKVRDWLATLDEREPFAGVTGPISFHESGDVVGKGVVVTRVRAGAMLVERASAGAGS
ncbi:MAG TPA: ABC transporter substrate-binding protein [Gemmatimonadaceae bacterium]|nr:ABC transporter substrate-binding protein [Gemmatimonadaceae bacterium]